MKKLQYEIDSALSVWPKDKQEICPAEIKDAFFEKGLIRSLERRDQVVRILNRLVRAGHIDKVGRGRYRLKSKPDEFKLFDLLSNMRERAHKENLVFTGRVGGTLWTANETCYLGMPENVTEEKDAWFLMSILELRLSRIFQSYQSLAYTLQQRQKLGTQIPLPGLIIREALAELLPWWLESKIGSDSDGLYITDLFNVTEQMIQQLPDTVESDGWTDSIRKDILMDYYRVIKNFMKIKEKYDEKQRRDGKQIDIEYEEEVNETNHRFAMIITEPEFNLNEDIYESRQIFSVIADSLKEKMDDLDIATDVLLYNHDIVIDVLRKYGSSKWGVTRSKKILSLYEKIYISNLISRWVGPFSNRISKDLIKAVNNFIEKGNKPKEIIYYLPFSHGSINFILPTEDKKKIIYQLFPDIPQEKIQEWYLDGVKEATKRVNITIEKLSEKFGEKAP